LQADFECILETNAEIPKKAAEAGSSRYASPMSRAPVVALATIDFGLA
jgi:hypothetical protein